MINNRNFYINKAKAKAMKKLIEKKELIELRPIVSDKILFEDLQAT